MFVYKLELQKGFYKKYIYNIYTFGINQIRFPNEILYFLVVIIGVTKKKRAFHYNYNSLTHLTKRMILFFYEDD